MTYAVTVAFKGSNTQWRFLFRSQDKAEQHKRFHSDHPVQTLIIEDDFGQHAEIKASEIAGVQVEDMEQSRLAHIEQLIFQTRIQKGAQDRLRRDPAMSVATPIPMLDPMGRPQ